jgi:hypothetical protein
LSSIAIGIPCNEGKNDHVVDNQIFIDADTKMKNTIGDGKLYVLVIQKNHVWHFRKIL